MWGKVEEQSIVEIVKLCQIDPEADGNINDYKKMISPLFPPHLPIVDASIQDYIGWCLQHTVSSLY